MLLAACIESARTWKLTNHVDEQRIGVCRFQLPPASPEAYLLPDDSAAKSGAAQGVVVGGVVAKGQPQVTMQGHVSQQWAKAYVAFPISNFVMPDMARPARIQGTIVLAVDVKGGAVNAIHILSGHPLFHAAAIEYVRQWRIEPTGDFTMAVTLEVKESGVINQGANIKDGLEVYISGVEPMVEMGRENVEALRIRDASTSEYSAAAASARVQGEVRLKVAVRDGRVIAAYVEKGPQELRKSAQDAALSWLFMPSVHGVFTSTFTYKLGQSPTAETKGNSPTHVVVMHE